MIKVEITKIYELHPEISTLECQEILDKRKCGNTTRQVDFAIQRFFEGYVVYAHDHFQKGKNRRANERLLQLIIHRLSREHNSVNLFLEGKIKIDLKELTIELV